MFCNNWQSTCADTLALYPLRCSNRNRERRPELVNFLRSRGYARELDLTAPPPPGGALEGTGSLVFDHVLGCAYLARSERSSEPLAARAAAALGFTRLHAFDAADEAGVPVYHTNVLLSVGTGWAVVCSECVVGEAARAGLEAALARGGREVVRITRSQMAAFCGNVLEVRDGDGLPCVAMSTAAHDAFTGEQRAALLRHTAALLHAPVPTLERVGGGGVRCCIGELF